MNGFSRSFLDGTKNTNTLKDFAKKHQRFEGQKQGFPHQTTKMYTHKLQLLIYLLEFETI